MSRKIDPSKGLSPEDRAYVLQRSWLQRDLGLKPEDLLGSEKSGEKPEEPKEPEVQVDDGLEKLTVKQLVERLTDRGLSTEGNKPELIARLREDDQGD